jgi:rhamnosyltransferase
MRAYGMTPLDRSTVAIVVAFRADADVRPLLAQLQAAVAQTVLVDNSHEGLPLVATIAPAPDLTVLANGNRGGLAGAYNHALAHLAKGPMGETSFTHVVFLDEDSDASALRKLLLDPSADPLLRQPDTACVAPAYVDKATGLRGKYIQLERWRLHYLPRQFSGLRRVAFVINSMSVWRRSALQQLGPFNEGLAIDHVDTEYCLRARRAGLAVHVHGSHEFLHAIGERKRFRFLGREMQAGGHSPARRYLIGRNTTWLGRNNVWHEPAFAFLCFTRLGYEVVGIGLAETRRPAKLWSLFRGIVVGLFTPFPR